MSNLMSFVGSEFEPYEFDYDETDTIIYALSIGAGASEHELSYVYERHLMALPTQPTAAGWPLFEKLNRVMGVDGRRKVHGEQRLRLHRAPPIRGRLRVDAKIAAVWDRGSGAVVDTAADICVDGEPVASAVYSSFIRGVGGFGGERGTGLRAPEVNDPPTTVITTATDMNQAVLYRLTGDRNPLHIDPEYARQAGFDRPILHGLCTYGFATRMAMGSLSSEEVQSIVAVDGRFVSPVYPGEVLRLEIWRTMPTQLYGRVAIDGVDRTVIDPLFITLLS